MPIRVKVLIGLMLASAASGVALFFRQPPHDWIRFGVYLLVILLTAGMKVAMPRGDGSMSVNFPFILLGILQLSPLQAMTLAAVSVLAQCRIPVIRPFTLVQIAFNLANVVASTALACLVFESAAGLQWEMAPALALASAAYFFANTVPVALVIGWSGGENPLLLWKREYPWYLPFYIVGAFLAAIVQWICIHLGWMTSLLIIPTVYTMYRAYRAQADSMNARQRHLDETKALHMRTIEGLAMAIEAKDRGTHDHLLRVRVYVSEIGRIMGLDDLQMQALVTASFLHDIGKLAVPEHIINKPGKLSPEEFDKMKIHPVVGADILERVRFPYPVTPIVRAHHEAWDGSGYPDGLKGEEIPIGARILAAVDCFDALASDRPYRRALPLDEAMAYVKSRAGSQFDPAVIAVLDSHYTKLELLAREDTFSISPLETNLSISRGAAPAAGFEHNSAPSLETEAVPVPPVAAAEARAPIVSNRASFPREALTLISAASKETLAIFEMNRSLGGSIRSNETASVMSFSLLPWIEFDCFAIYLAKGDSLSRHYMDGIGASSFSGEDVAAGEGLSGWVLESGKPIVNGNPEVEPNYIGKRGSIGQMRSALSVPLFETGKEPFGVLTLYSSQADCFSAEQLRILLAVQPKFSLSLKNALMFHDANEDARVDFLTQLPNYRHFCFELERALEEARYSGRSLGVMVCDLNAFKAINDTLGHAMGNRLLRAVADAFRLACRKEDMVARIGGDEFGFLLPGAEVESCAMKQRSLELAVKAACEALGAEFEVSASVGAAFFPEDCGSADSLLDLADRRMYAHKQSMQGANGLVRSNLAFDLPDLR